MNILRIKPHIIVFINHSNTTLHFLFNPFKGVVYEKDDIVFGLLAHLKGQFSLEEVIKRTEGHYTQQKVKRKLNELLSKGILEFFDPNNENLHKYERYDRQLNFFDLFTHKKNRKDLYLLQDKLSNSHVLILGVGGIGSFASFALAGAGIGTITLFDGDTIELSNLNRQILYDEPSIGKKKIEVAKERLEQFNSNICYNVIYEHLSNESELEDHINRNNLGKIDMILLSADSSINIRTWVEKYGRKYSVPYISCGYAGDIGMVGPLIDDYSTANKSVVPKNLEKIKVGGPASMGATNGILSNIACLEIIKYLTGISPPVTKNKRMLINFNDLSIKCN